MLVLWLIFTTVFLGLMILLKTNHSMFSIHEMSSFECGFNMIKSFNSSFFSNSYFFYGILFLLFDIELCILVPFLGVKHTSGCYGAGLILLVCLLIFYVAEIESSLFDWEY